jgi:putative PIN family toxin of toxin-antitoxin system
MPPGGSARLPHAVLDTNILVSALLRPDGPPGRVLAAVKAGDLVPVFSAAMLAEYDAVLRHPQLRLDAVRVAAALEQLQAIGILVRATAPPPADLPDGSDWLADEG